MKKSELRELIKEVLTEGVSIKKYETPNFALNSFYSEMKKALKDGGLK